MRNNKFKILLSLFILIPYANTLFANDSSSKRINASKVFYTGFSYGAGQVLKLQGEYYSKQKVFKAVVAAEPGCNANSIPAKVNFSMRKIG